MPGGAPESRWSLKAILLTFAALYFVFVVTSVSTSMSTKHVVPRPEKPEEIDGQIRSSGKCVSLRLLKVLNRVACVGDSITYGNGSHVGKMERPKEGNYPLELQRLLNEYVLARAKAAAGCPAPRSPQGPIKVLNFGHSGRTMQDGFKQSFRNSSVYGQAMSSKPSLVLLLMGTNDSKPRHWRGSDAFRAALVSMATEFAAMPSQPIVVLLTPPPAFADPRKLLLRTEVSRNRALKFLGGINNSRIRESIVPVIREAPALLGPEFAVVDTNEMFEQRLSDLFVAAAKMTSSADDQGREVADGARRVAEYFHDGIHPTRKTHDMLATWVMEKLVSMFDDDTQHDTF